MVVALLVLGCDRPQADFEGLVHTLQANLSTNELARPITYDIRKTDSLITPLIGQIQYTEIRRHYPNSEPGGDNWMGDEHRFTLAYQDHRWVFTRAEGRITWASGPTGPNTWCESAYPEIWRHLLGLQ